MSAGTRVAVALAISLGVFGGLGPSSGEVVAQGLVSVSPAGDRSSGSCPYSYSVEQAQDGNCSMTAIADAEFSAMTPFGRLSFAFCELSYVVHFQSGGGVAVEDVAIDGPTPCGDVRPCQELIESEPPPWHGRVETRDRRGYAMELDACFDTCIGWFEGPLRLDLDRIDGRWRVRAARTPIGDSGLEIRGDWWLEGRDVRLKPA